MWKDKSMRIDTIAIVVIHCVALSCLGCDSPRKIENAKPSQQKTEPIQKEFKKITRNPEKSKKDRIRFLKIKSQTQWEYFFRFGKPADPKYKEFYVRYDTLG